VFLRHKHTRDSMRRLRFSDLTSQPAPAGGMQDPQQVARDKVETILRDHQPQPLDEAQDKEFERILKAADAEFASPPTGR